MTDTTSLPLTRLEGFARHCLLLAMFSVPFSTALTNIFVGFTYISFALALFTSPALRRGLRQPPALIALALLGLLLLGATWSIGQPGDIATALRKYVRLLVLPIAVALCWRDAALPVRALRWTLAGSAVLATSTYLVWLGAMPTSAWGWWRAGDAADPFVFRNHITIGILLGFAACACFLASTYYKGAARALAAAAGVYFSIPIVMLGQGRTGYVALFIGLVTLFLLRTRVTPLRTAAGIGAIVLMFIGFYSVAPNFKARTNALFTEVSTHAEQSPNGLRMSYMKVGAQLVAQHPLLGLGTGGFAEAYAPTARSNWPEDSPMHSARHQPHSEFMLMAVQLGVVGLALYVALLATLGRSALAVRSLEADTFVLLWMVYVASSTFNSLLWDPTEAYWFLLLSGCLYAYCTRLRQPQPVRQPGSPAVLTPT